MRVIRIVKEPSVKIPLMSEKVAAGFPSPATDYIEDTIDIAKELVKHPSATFFIRVTGHSMEPQIPDGALLIVDRSLPFENNTIILAALDGEFTVKRYVLNENGRFLYPENRNYKPLQITPELNLIFWGVVTYIIIDTKLYMHDRAN